MLLYLHIVALFLVCYATAQSSSASYVEATVPNGKPIAGTYDGALRPQVHYSPPIDFMVSCFVSNGFEAEMPEEPGYPFDTCKIGNQV